MRKIPNLSRVIKCEANHVTTEKPRDWLESCLHILLPLDTRVRHYCLHITPMEGISGWWNNACLDSPPFLAYPTKKNHVRRRLQKLIDKQAKLPAKKHLTTEVAILKKLEFKLKLQFRRFKKFQAIQRLRVCFDKYEAINIKKVYDTMASNPDETDEMTLGSRQMLEFVLTKTLCAVHLLSRSCDHCFAAIELTKGDMERDLFINQNIVLFSCLSRLWVLCAFLTFEMVNLYDEMYQLLRFLRASPVPWIPDGEKLPESLTEFLTSGSLKHIPKSSRSKTEDISTYITKTFQNTEKTQQLTQIDKVNVQIENIGTLVPRSQYAAAKPDITSKDTLVRDLAELKTRKQILTWLRKENNSPTISASLTERSWKNLKKCIQNAFNTPKVTKWVKQTIINWFKTPNRYLKLYKTDKLQPNCKF